MWDSRIGAYIANALQLMNDPESPKTNLDDALSYPEAPIRYRLADGTMVSYAQNGEELRLELAVQGGRVEIKVSCRRCRNCQAYLFPDTGKYCAHCGAEKGGGGKTTLDRELFI